MLMATCFRLLVLLVLAAMTDAATDKKEYPPAALQADACFTGGQLCYLSAALYDSGTKNGTGTVTAGYSVTFSSEDGRWNYSPKNMFNKVTAGHPGQWQEGSYYCAPPATECTYRYSQAAIGTLSDTGPYIGEWVKLELPAAQEFTTMSFWASTIGEGAGGRPYAYKVYGSSDGTSWTLVHNVTAETGIANDGTKSVTLNSPASFSKYILIVNKLAGSSITLTLYELVFYTAGVYCMSNKYAVDATPSACTLCTQGTYSTSLNALTCTGKCPAGTYMPSQTAPTSCVTCEAGKYSADAASVCVDCAAGKFSTVIGAKTSEVCSPCTYGSWSAVAATACTLCGAGTFRGLQETSCKNCTGSPPSIVSPAGATACTDTCPAGSYLLSGSLCEPCTAGKFKGASGDSVTDCSNCVAGKFSGRGLAATECLTCPVGGYSNTTASYCTRCEAGKYGKPSVSVRDNSGNSCLDCPVGKSSLPGAAALTDCIACGPGKFASATGSPVCADCPAGTFASSSTSDTCTNCPAGKYSATGAIACTTCPVGCSTSAWINAACNVCQLY
jgi:hypothetical protein